MTESNVERCPTCGQQRVIKTRGNDGGDDMPCTDPWHSGEPRVTCDKCRGLGGWHEIFCPIYLTAISKSPIPEDLRESYEVAHGAPMVTEHAEDAYGNCTYTESVDGLIVRLIERIARAEHERNLLRSDAYEQLGMITSENFVAMQKRAEDAEESERILLEALKLVIKWHESEEPIGTNYEQVMSKAERAIDQAERRVK